jgi:hypothetical protein
MAYPPRKIAFILASTDHGTLIVNRFDYHVVNATSGFGVGYFLLENSSYEQRESSVAMQLLALRRQHFGGGVLAVDCGANIGVLTVEWAKGMTGWGTVLAIEAQERIYYALGGNIAINNCFNAHAIHGAVGAENGVLRIPTPNYMAPASFGSLELRQSAANEFIGQEYRLCGAKAEQRADADDRLAEAVAAGPDQDRCGANGARGIGGSQGYAATLPADHHRGGTEGTAGRTDRSAGVLWLRVVHPWAELPRRAPSRSNAPGHQCHSAGSGESMTVECHPFRIGAYRK